MERATVFCAEVEQATALSLILKTTAAKAVRTVLSSADTEMMNQRERLGNGERVEGRIRLDVVSDTIFRFRYAEGTSVPDNITPMVVGQPAAPTHCEIVTESGQVLITTGAARVTIQLSPYQVRITDLQGKKICDIGGTEKNYFCMWDAYNTGISRSRDDGTCFATENFALAPDECIYGLGERFTKLNKVGQRVDLDMCDALGTISPRAYKNIPFYVSNKGYGVYFNQSSLMTFWLGSMAATDVQVALIDDFLDYYVIAGSIKDVLSQYTDLTGKGVVPPKWTFGYWQSKFTYHSAEEALAVARGLREHDIPADVIHLDTDWFKADWYCDLQFDPVDFPDPAAFFREMDAMGFKISLWQLPYIPEGCALFEELKAVDGFVKTPEGAIYDNGICFTPGFTGIVGVVDYTNPEAVRVHQDWFRKLFRLGAKVIKTDFGEYAPVDGIYADGTPGSRAHNLYPLLYNKAVFEVTQEETGGGVVWARSAWAGSQRYPIHWGGDISTNWENLEPQLESGLSFGLSGFQFWSHDIGGFVDQADGDMLIRWYQFGVFNSHSRSHGAGDSREPYKYDPATRDICRDYLRLRYRLLPYIYGSALASVVTSLPMLRALVIEYQDDPTVWNIGDEYLFGDSLLVAPVLTAESRRRLYLPEGVWTDWWTGERIMGGSWRWIEPDIRTLPLYLREGGIVPMGPAMNYVDEIPTTEITLYVSLFAGDGVSRFDVPVNDETVPVEYRAAHGQHTIRIGHSSVKFSVKTYGGGDVSIQHV
ncbi:MAG TPA: TIM-barrel domain-containing protein [Armatimonadota bacterium]